jgi:23S rRNA (adenine2503-C2)-methyltransferase
MGGPVDGHGGTLHRPGREGYSTGVDPAKLFGSVIKLGWDDYESVLNMLPSNRRLQKLGPETVEKLASLYRGIYGPSVKKVEGGVAALSHISRARDGTTKLLLKLSDGLEVETVIIPWRGKRSTLCVSSQVGCRQGRQQRRGAPLGEMQRLQLEPLFSCRTEHDHACYFFCFSRHSVATPHHTLQLPGCTFCATGRMGRIRNLTADEILAQMYWGKKLCRLEELPEISNVVFMGMGEPSDNAANVVRAAEQLTTREMFSLSASRVTVSTVGPTPASFMDFASARCVLAWSVHAVNDELRRRLVPTTRHSMVDLRRGLIDALLVRPFNARTCMLEVALMRGVNDGPEHADELADFTQVIIDEVPGVKPHINLIPFNEIGVHSAGYERPSNGAVLDFQKRLQAKGMHVHVRATRGDDKTAACGQLATSQRKPSSVKMP